MVYRTLINCVYLKQFNYILFTKQDALRFLSSNTFRFFITSTTVRCCDRSGIYIEAKDYKKVFGHNGCTYCIIRNIESLRLLNLHYYVIGLL